MGQITATIGKRGVLVIPTALRKQLGLDEGELVILEQAEGGLLVRRAVALPVEVYSPRRKAELLLGNAVDEEDYERAMEEVRRLGVDPSVIPHETPWKS